MIIRSKFSKTISLVSFDEELNNLKLHKQYLKWLNDIDIVKPIASPTLLKKKKIDFIYKSFERFTKKTSQGFFIKYNESMYIGTCKLDQIDHDNSSAWDGIMIGEKEFHGKGLSIEVYRVLLHYAFEILNLKVVFGGCSSYNLAMVKTFQKLGYKLFEKKTDIDYIDKKYYDHFYFKLTKINFLKNQKDINERKKSLDVQIA